MPDYSYDAFISYRRSDGAAVARWLRRALEGYRAPKPLRATATRKLRVFLNSAYERGASDFYEQSIKPPLLSSRYLIVVATPDAVRRSSGADWIEREIRDFGAGANGQNVIVVRGAGDFTGPLPGDLEARFPNIEIVDLRGAGRFSFLQLIRAGRLASEKLKLIAPLLDIPFDQMPLLRQEEEKRQHTRLGALIGATLGILIAVSGLSVFALVSRNQALRAAEDGMYAAGTMAQLATVLDTQDDDTAQTRGLIVNQGCDLVDKFRQATVIDPPVREFVMCRLERARQREGLKEYDEARKHYLDALEFAHGLETRLHRADAGLGIVRAQEAYAVYLLRRKDAAGAEAGFAELLKEAQRLSLLHKGRTEFSRAEAEALGQTGDLLVARGVRREAAGRYEAAAGVVANVLLAKNEDGGKAPAPATVAWLARLHRLAGVQHKETGNRGEAIEQYRQSVKAAGHVVSDQPSPQVEYEVAIAQALLVQEELNRGDAAAARAAKQAGLASVDRVEKSRSSAEFKKKAADVKRFIDNQKIPD